MRMPSLESLQQLLSQSSAPTATLTPYRISGSTYPAYLTSRVCAELAGPPKLLAELRAAQALYPVFIPTGHLDYLLPPGADGDDDFRRYSETALAESWLEAMQTLPRSSPMYTELQPWDGGLRDFVIHRVRERFGEGPDPSVLQRAYEQGQFRNDCELERWLLRWELERFGAIAREPRWRSQADDSYLCGRQGGQIVLLPVETSWEAFALLLWYASERELPQKIAAMRRWQERYGAELCSMGITLLYMQVKRKPVDLDEAFELAIEHDCFAGCTVSSDVSLREHARVLLSQDHWFLHERP